MLLVLSSPKADLGGTAVAIIGVHTELHSTGARLTEAERLLATGTTNDIEGRGGCLSDSGDILWDLHWGAHG